MSINMKLSSSEAEVVLALRQLKQKAMRDKVNANKRVRDVRFGAVVDYTAGMYRVYRQETMPVRIAIDTLNSEGRLRKVNLKERSK